MKRVSLKAEIREDSGKGVARSLRRSGKIPAVVYGEGKSRSLAVDQKELLKILTSGGNVIINLSVTGSGSSEPRPVILRDYQEDPVSEKLLHADFFEVNMKKPIRLTVPILMTGGQPAGVKEGGVLQHTLRDVEIEALPASIPDHIEMDASQLQIGESIHLGDLQVSEGVRILGDKGLGVVSIAAPMSEEKLEQILAGTPAGEGREPEVIGKKKDEGEAVAQGEAAAGAKPEEKKEEPKG